MTGLFQYSWPVSDTSHDGAFLIQLARHEYTAETIGRLAVVRECEQGHLDVCGRGHHDGAPPPRAVQQLKHATVGPREPVELERVHNLPVEGSSFDLASRGLESLLVL